MNRALDERQKYEKETVVATENLNKLRLDNEDIIQYLQRSLQSRDDECSELKERLKGLQLVRLIPNYSILMLVQLMRVVNFVDSRKGN